MVCRFHRNRVAGCAECPPPEPTTRPLREVLADRQHVIGCDVAGCERCYEDVDGTRRHRLAALNATLIAAVPDLLDVQDEIVAALETAADRLTGYRDAESDAINYAIVERDLEFVRAVLAKVRP